MAGSRLIRVPNAAVVSRRSASISRVNGTTGRSTASPIPTSQSSGVILARVSGPATSEATSAGDRHRDRQTGDTGDLVADPLGQQDVRRPAARPRPARRPRRPGPPDPTRAAVSSSDTDAREQRPGEPVRAPAAGDRHPERPEELQRTRHPQRQPCDGGHEQQGESRDHHPEEHAGHEARPGEPHPPGAADQHHQRTGPDQAEPRGPLGAELVDQPHRDGEPELHAQHRRGRHQGTGPGRRPGRPVLRVSTRGWVRVMGPVKPQQNRSRPREMQWT